MAGAPERRAPADGTTHLLRASLKPKLYRDVEIDSMASLAALAEAITGAFEFDFDHAYGFYSTLTDRYHDSPEKYELFADIEGGDSDADSVQETAVSKAFSKAGKKMLFLFDYGDEWRFTVELIKLGEKIAGTRYPRLVGTSGDAPEQYPDMDED